MFNILPQNLTTIGVNQDHDAREYEGYYDDEELDRLSKLKRKANLEVGKRIRVHGVEGSMAIYNGTEGEVVRSETKLVALT